MSDEKTTTSEPAASVVHGVVMSPADLSRILLMHSVDALFVNCGNSYVNKYTEIWLVHAKSLGAYFGRTTGTIIELRDEWSDYLDSVGGLPEMPVKDEWYMGPIEQ